MNEELIDEALTDLDDSWIVEFENIDNEYKNFYKENIQSVKLRYLYINKNNCLEKIKEENIILKVPNILSKEEIIGILKKNNTLNTVKYSLLGLLKYNIDLEPINLKNFLKKELDTNYLTSVKTIDTIYFKPSIYMFQDLTDIFILFCEKNQNNNNNKSFTKKIYIQSSIKNKTYKKIT